MEILNKALEKIPGLAYVFAIAALLMLNGDSEIAAGIRVFVVAWSLYRISSSLDALFDLFYGPRVRTGGIWTGRLTRFWSYRRAGEVWYQFRRHLPGYRTLEENRKRNRNRAEQMEAEQDEREEPEEIRDE